MMTTQNTGGENAISLGLRAMVSNQLIPNGGCLLGTAEEIDRLESRLAQAEKEREELRESRLRKREALKRAVKTVLEGFDKGLFVRSTVNDAEPGWAMKFIPYLGALKELKLFVDDEKEEE